MPGPSGRPNPTRSNPYTASSREYNTRSGEGPGSRLGRGPRVVVTQHAQESARPQGVKRGFFSTPRTGGVTSDPHGHDDVPVLVIVPGVFGAELAGGLGILELQADLAGISSLEEIQQVLRIKADGNRFALVV